MKASTVDEVKREFREVKGEANKSHGRQQMTPLWKVKMKTKSGESQRKTGHAEKARGPSGLRVCLKGAKPCGPTARNIFPRKSVGGWCCACTV